MCFRLPRMLGFIFLLDISLFFINHFSQSLQIKSWHFCWTLILFGVRKILPAGCSLILQFELLLYVLEFCDHVAVDRLRYFVGSGADVLFHQLKTFALIYEEELFFIDFKIVDS